MAKNETNIGVSPGAVMQIGILAITMQRSKDRVTAWLQTQAAQGVITAQAGQSPDWEAYAAAAHAYQAALNVAARAGRPTTLTAIALAETVNGRPI